MPAWAVLVSVPGAIVMLAAVLALSQAIEQRVLSPQAMILGTARARRARPDYVEGFVALQLERLLREAPQR
jgi:hypothetical protein